MFIVLIILGEPQKISASDKGMVRENILVFITQVPPLLRCTIWHANFPFLLQDLLYLLAPW